MLVAKSESAARQEQLFEQTSPQRRTARKLSRVGGESTAATWFRPLAAPRVDKDPSRDFETAASRQEELERWGAARREIIPEVVPYGQLV